MDHEEQRRYLMAHGWRRVDRIYHYSIGPDHVVELWLPPDGKRPLTLLAAVRQQHRATRQVSNV
jgi:hypothetical protein